MLEPFFEATLQLSNDGSCISEVNIFTIAVLEYSHCLLHQVIPIVTQLKESLSKVSEDERGACIKLLNGPTLGSYLIIRVLLFIVMSVICLADLYICKFLGTVQYLGVKTFKKDLLASIERRMGHFEEVEQFSLATALDPR